MNRIDEFADALEGWLVEWAEKRQQASAALGSGESETELTGLLRKRAGDGHPEPNGVLGYVEEDGGFVSDWRDAEGLTDASAESERWK
jgi:hypothetical protein